MSKFLLFILFVGLAWWWFRGRGVSRGLGGGAPVTPPVERMVVCHGCGVYLPESDALVVRGHPYCCAEHVVRDDG